MVNKEGWQEIERLSSLILEFSDKIDDIIRENCDYESCDCGDNLCQKAVYNTPEREMLDFVNSILERENELPSYMWEV